MAYEQERRRYGAMYGPAVGDRIRLADTDLIIEVENNLIPYGDEINAGVAKTARDGMGASSTAPRDSCLDVVISNVVVLDPVLGITKADIGIKDGRLAGIGNAGNPDTMSGLDMVVGTTTSIISGAGLIATPGGLDVHIHYLSPGLVPVALASGLTTMVGGGVGLMFDVGVNPQHHIETMIRAFEAFPMNVGFLGRGSSSTPAHSEYTLACGACGLKMHEDMGISPAVIDCCLRVADRYDVQAFIHTDSLNESGHFEETMAAIAGRTIHAYHCEGAGGGHAPDILQIVSYEHVLPSSTNPTNPFTRHTLAEHLEMIMTVHWLNPNIPEDVAMAESRIRAETVAAEDVLHDLGAVSMMSSDSMGMGRVGETILRTWQLAHKMKLQRGAEGEHDNARVLRYLAKYTINPAIATGIGAHVGSLESGKLADVVLWRPKFFGVKPELVIKGGVPVMGATGSADASIRYSEPVYLRPLWGAVGSAPPRLSLLFTSKLAHEQHLARRVPTTRRVVPVQGTRVLRKQHMVRNAALPAVKVNPETYEVSVDGQRAWCEPVDLVPMNQLYFL